MKAAGRIFEKLTRYNKPQISNQNLEAEKEELLSDLSTAIGETTEKYSLISNLFNKRSKKMRINNYRKLSQQKEYGGLKLEKYDKYKWLDKVIGNPVKLALYKLQRKIPLIPVFIEAAKDKFKDIFGFDLSFRYVWKDESIYKNTNWFNFQKAVKELQEKGEDILKSNTFSKMELEKL